MNNRKKYKNNYLLNSKQKLKIEQHESHFMLGTNSGTPTGPAVPSPLVAPVVLLLLQTR